MSSRNRSATDYHRATSYRRHQLAAHSLDWAHQPVPVKRYPDLPRIPLTHDVKLPAINYFDLLQRGPNHSAPLDIENLSTVIRLTHDVSARAMHGGKPFYYRSVASAGALYPFELYLAVHHIDGLAPGVYHYDLFDFSLTALRREPVPEIPPADRSVAATFFITGIFFRSAWKYRSRAYRYVLLDAGHLLENLRLALSAQHLDFAIHLDFDDDRAASVLGIDPQREAALVCVHLHGAVEGGETTDVDAAGESSLPNEILQASTVSHREVVYPDILSVHRAGNKAGNRSVDSLPALNILKKVPASWVDSKLPDIQDPVDYARILWQRRSHRNFIPASVSWADLMTFLTLMMGHMGAVPAMPPACRSALATGFLAGAGMPVAPGFYLLDPDANRLGCVFENGRIEPMAAACLDQMWLKHATVHLLFMTDLAALDQTWGPRGYRYAMIEAGRLGQQAYLAATALGWGACGIGAIYDREAADLLKLTDDGALLYLVGAGPVKRR